MNAPDDDCKSFEKSSLNKVLQGHARGCDKSGRRESNPHNQLGRLEGQKHNISKQKELQNRGKSVCTSVCTRSGKKAEFCPELREIIESWSGLPEPVKAGIMAMVQATGKSK